MSSLQLRSPRRSASESGLSQADHHHGASPLWRQVLETYSYVVLWIVLSGATILYNKYVLAYAGFPYPITLTMWHMFFCATLAIALVRSGKVASANLDRQTYVRAVVPIGLCYAVTLWVGNAAYLYLSVSFIQMLKALMPVAVFIVGCSFKVDKFDLGKMGNMVIVTLGVTIASSGEINFVLTGVLYQLTSLVSESIRLVLVQMLLQSRGLKLNPITTLYYVAPCCFAFLLPPWLFLEAGKITSDSALVVRPGLLVSNAAVAFGLNMSVFLLIGKTSALTMNISGVAKDWLLIAFSVWLYKSPVTRLQLFGYFIAFLGICWYNYQKLQQMSQGGSQQQAGAKEEPPQGVGSQGGEQAKP